MYGVNKVIILGNLGRDPEQRSTQKGERYTTFSVATTRSWKNHETGKIEEKTDWHRITTFGKLAENCFLYLKKGKSVYIEGLLSTYEKIDENGKKQWRTSVRATEVTFLADSKRGFSPASKEISEAMPF